MPLEDDATLQGNVELVRVLVSRGWYTSNDDGTERPSSGAFVESTNEASCFVLAETSLELIALRFPNKKLGVVTVGAAREAGFIVARDPDGGDGIAGHVLLIQQTALPESKHHVRLARQLATTGRVMEPPQSRTGVRP